MGLTASSVGHGLSQTAFVPVRKREDDVIVALMGNPNVGKSTVFNCLTGLKQHTGNWPGKTVSLAQGRFEYRGRGYVLVDLPGTYSLLSHSPEEEVAAEFLRSGQADCVLCVCDATCLERSLSLVLQAAAEAAQPMGVCLNLMDEARRSRMEVDADVLQKELGLPVVPTSAGRGEGMEELKECLRRMTEGEVPAQCCLSLPRECSQEELTEWYLQESHIIARSCLSGNQETPACGKVDRFLTGKFTGGAVMLLLLLGVFWLTIRGANYPSRLLELFFARLGTALRELMTFCHIPRYIANPLLDGVYATTAQVIAVMLPPMAIFFPLFTLLEDLGYLPRVAFLLDRPFQACGGCGKQALTMCMGFGCNAAGVVGCRILHSEKDRKVAMITNALVPCNGRFPMLISLISVFFSQNGLASAGMLTGMILLSVGMTFLVSAVLNKTLGKGERPSFVMELPPFRRPRVLQILYRSLLDRTVYVLARAAAVAAPAGLLLWCMTNVTVGGNSLLRHLCVLLEPLGRLMGVDGAVPAAFLLGFPANELVLPILLTALDQGGDAAGLLQAGWTWQTALCTMVFCLFHWPCSTTCLTVCKESRSIPITILAVLIPTAVGIVTCMLLNLLL